MRNPLLTIVTVVLNSVDIIEETIKSIIVKLNDDTEFIVIDGGSSDGTVEIIKKYQSYLSYWHSEKDSGIFCAMNKGIEKGIGDYFYFINAGDFLFNLPLGDIANNSNMDLLAFPVKLSDGSIFLPSLKNDLKLRNTLPHQGCFYKKASYFKFDIRFKVFADWHLNQCYIKTGKAVKLFGAPVIALHNIQGVSHDKKSSSELFKVVKDNYGFLTMIRSYINFKFDGMRKRLKVIIC